MILFCWQVYVAQDLADPTALTMSVDYETQVELTKPILIDEGRMATFSLLRDAVVDAAKAEGRLPSSVSPQEFMLRVSEHEKSLLKPSWLRIHRSVWLLRPDCVQFCFDSVNGLAGDVVPCFRIGN